MQLKSGAHLAYCTNIHCGETWGATLNSLQRYTLAVRDAVAPGVPYAIGLRVSSAASVELLKPAVLREFLSWLEQHNCYVFTINGFPFGRFHGSRVKENVYLPDWTSRERLEYTKRLFTILNELMQVAPKGCEGSVSTLPGSFKLFGLTKDSRSRIRENLWECVNFIEKLSSSGERQFHLGLEPEPLGLFETTSETIGFFDQLAAHRDGDERWRKFLGINYDVCHLACEYETPAEAFRALEANGIKISKIHLSSALKVIPTVAAMDALWLFADDVYLHQVIARTREGILQRYRDLPEALACPPSGEELEWRIHFHVPLHWSGEGSLFGSTAAANTEVLTELTARPEICRHLEIETYTWDVLPPALRSRNVVEQIAAEYAWCFGQMQRCGLM